jgi:hypothetical protein
MLVAPCVSISRFGTKAIAEYPRFVESLELSGAALTHEITATLGRDRLVLDPGFKIAV